MHDKALGILILSQYLQDMNCTCHNSVTVTPVAATSWAQSALTPTEWVTGAGACFQVWLPMQLLKLDLSVQSVLKDEVILQSSNLYVKFPLGLLLRGTWSLLLNRKPVGISGLENGLCWNTSQGSQAKVVYVGSPAQNRVQYSCRRLFIPENEGKVILCMYVFFCLWSWWR